MAASVRSAATECRPATSVGGRRAAASPSTVQPCARRWWARLLSTVPVTPAMRAVLRVRRAHAEAGAPAGTAERLMDELRLAAGWLGLDRVEVASGDALADELRAMRARRSDA